MCERAWAGASIWTSLASAGCITIVAKSVSGSQDQSGPGSDLAAPPYHPRITVPC